MSTSSSPRRTSAQVFLGVASAPPHPTDSNVGRQDDLNPTQTASESQPVHRLDTRPSLIEPTPTDTLSDEDAPFPAPELDIPYEDPTADEPLLPPPDFAPFFTLIEDRTTNEHHHPSVHYLFADDDPEIVTALALESLGAPTSVASASTTGGTAAETGPADAEHAADSSDDTEQRCVLIDLAADGRTVTGAASFSPEWQALRATVTPAPSWGGAGSGGGNGNDLTEVATADRGLMLRISGQQISSHSRGEGGGVGMKEKKRAQGGSGELEELVRGFDERLAGLDGVLGMQDLASAAPADVQET